VVENVFVVAPGILEGVGEDGHAREVVVIVHLVCEGLDQVRTPFGKESDRAKRVSQHLPDKCRLPGVFRVAAGTSVLSGVMHRVSERPVLRSSSAGDRMRDPPRIDKDGSVWSIGQHSTQ
jgi:hypothetical protein